MATFMDVAIVGAGPYGLSLAAQLRAAGCEFRIFGHPMRPWQDNMPPGMLLKSDGTSTNLSAPGPGYAIAEFCRENALPFFGDQRPLDLATFIAYGRAFQSRFVPDVEETDVLAIEPAAGGFALSAATGETVRAARVVLAVGVLPFSFVPECLAPLAPELASHSALYGPVDRFAGKEVAVIGSGASAIDLAAALHDHGARPTIIARRREIAFHQPPTPTRSRLQSLRYPDSGIGGGWRLKICADAPLAIHMLPARYRVAIATGYLGPAPGWFMKERIVGKVPVLSATTPVEAAAAGGRVRLQLRSADGSRSDFTADHVIAATGYKIDVERFEFLDRRLRAGLRTVAQAPALSRNFETSVRGLYCVGPAALMSFGPVMRFVYGADRAVRRLQRHLSKASLRHGLSMSSQPRSVAPAAGAEVGLLGNRK
jgi:thioredoxin reductase